MERRTCGGGLSLPVLGVGCWAYGGTETDYWGEQGGQDVEAVVNAALDAGVNYFDTAEGYNDGRSEIALGQALGKRRQEAIIGTKVSPAYASPELLRKHCEASLRRLGTDYIDLYMLHWPITEYSVEPAFETLAALQFEGKIRHIGLSNFGVNQLRQVVATGAKIVTNQLYYNLLSRAIEFDILPECRRLGIGVVAYMPLQQGLLTGKYHSLDDLPAMRTRTRHFRGDRPLSRHGGPGAEDRIMAILDELKRIVLETGLSMTHLALAWVVHQPGIACALTGIRRRTQLDEAIAGVSVRLSPSLLERLDRLTAPLKEQLGPGADYFQALEDSRIH